ncbi:MFS transporter [Saccharopolyspora elongata]|uniref:MFS transporter n=1 Tax=Saccharopolyspora elongata TaxID=2530387 RepID=A0A4R4XUK8_9PSEU|nr:MFS transporter [Saccharopolyspora elongata]TDD35033.1 MFS transporter [Saccharopolyspora elongata]
MSTNSPAGPALLARLERLPVSRPHFRLMLMGGLGIAFDGMDGSLVSYVLPAVTPLWGLAPWQTGLLGSSLLIGIMIGALSAGLAGDAIGRRRIMMYALAVYCVATVAAAFAPDWGFFFVARLIAGIGVGAEAAIIPAFMSEFVPGRIRGLFVGSIAGFFSLGYIAAALLGTFFVPAFPDGWRVAQLVTAAPLLMLLWWRRALPESPRWLIDQGRLDEAETVVAQLEERVERATGKPLPPVEEQAAPEPVRAAEQSGTGSRMAGLWLGGMARRTAVLWLLWISLTFAYYGFFTWIPSLLVQQGMTMSKSFTYSLLITIAQVPGYYSAAYLSERLDRKRTIAGYLIGGAIAAFLLSQGSADAQVLIFGALLSFFMNGTYAALYAYTPEVYPTRMRATGTGAASAFGRIGGIVAPIIIGLLYASIGFGGVFTMVTGALVAGALGVLVFGVSTSGRTLEELTGTAARGQQQKEIQA